MDLKPRRLTKRRLTKNAELRLAIDNFIGTAETCDVRRKKHQIRVTNLCDAIGKRVGLDKENLKGLRVSALLHDLGLLRVPDEVLGKSSALTSAEIALIREHPKTGCQFLSHVDFPWPVAEIVLQHHEHYDGSGYPNGLIANQIRIEAKILRVADTIESLTSRRPHRPAATLIEATRELAKKCGSLYDPYVVDAYVQLVHGKELRVDGWSTTH